jgi:hypothetical protein
MHVFQHDAVAFEVRDTLGDARRIDNGAPYPGLVRPLLDWTTDVAPLTAPSAVEV